MPIELTCDCGKRLRLPDEALGRRVRCRSCGAVFTVPGEPGRAVTAAGRRANGAADVDASGDSGTAVAPGGAAGRELPLADEPLPAHPPPLRQRIRRIYEGVPPGPDDEPDTPRARGDRKFWNDLVASFGFFRHPANLITLAFITVMHLLLIPLSYAGILGIFGMVIVYAYLCAFYLSTIVDTASGDDVLPGIYPSENLLTPLWQFAGTFIWVLLPALGLAATMHVNAMPVQWEAVAALVLMGILEWPVVVLSVALGGTFRGLWPDLMIRTALSAPLAYLTVCVAILVAFAIMLLPRLPWVQVPLVRFAPGLRWALPFIDAVLSSYAMIVTMRVIGLFYRHFKQRFPWRAE